MESGAGNMKSTTKKSHLIAGLVLFALCLLVPAMAQAQELRGKITGRVTDASGAVIPGATVKVTDVARATTTTLTTNEEGLFDAPYLLPGTYRVAVEIAGFKKAQEDNVQVAINDTRVLNIKLDVGNVTETVSVTDTAAILSSADADLGTTLDRKRVDELPSIHGDPYALIASVPGVTYTGSTRLDRPFEPTHIVGYAMTGTRGNRSDLLIDGAPSTATANGNEVIASYVPPTDITQEFKVQTATYDAQFGNTEGGVTSIAIKSGTNNLHGTAYIWTEPGGMAANDFFGNARGQARPFTYSNRPGGSVSGPVYLPGIYDGRNKTFFLFSYEGIRDSRPRFDASNVWVPTDALKIGDFSAYSSNITIYDPLTGTYNSNGTVTNRTPFPNNIIPGNRINAVAKALFPAFGSPKNPSVLTGNINDSTLAEKTRKYDNYTYRIDQNFGGKDRFFWRYSAYTRDSSYNNYTGTSYIGDRFGFISKQTVLDDVHTFNGTTILNVGYGYNRFIRATDAPEGQRGLDLTTLGFPSYYNGYVSEGIRRFPRLDFNCTSCTGATLGNGHTNENRPVDSHSFKAVLNWTHSKHSIKAGSEMRIYREDDSFKSNNQTGQFVFDNTYTRVGSASSADYQGLQAFAAFLLGYPTTAQLVRAADYSEYSKTWGFFGQDDFRISQKLTLNLGLRWEFETPLVERQNKSVSGFDAAYTQPIEAQAQSNYAALTDSTLKTTLGLSQINVKGGLLFAAKDTGRGLYHTPKNGFLPRLGFAYQLNDKTMVRGGFGLFQGFLGERRGDVLQSGYSQTTNTPLTTGPNGAPLPALLSTPFLNATILEPTGNSLGKQTALGQSITFFNQDPKVSKQARWSLGFQRQLWGGWIVEANYVGDIGSDIEIARNLNALPSQYLNTDSSRTQAMQTANTNLTGTVSNPFSGLVPNASPTISRQSLLAAYPEFGSANTTNNDGKSWYHSGQFTLSRRFTKGYGIQWSYTRSKWIQQTEYLNASDPKPTKMISDQDAPNRFATSGFYELPFGKGRTFGKNVNRFVDVLIGGWQIEGTYGLQSGFPVAFTSDAFLTGAKIAIPKSQQTVNHWFNTDAFVSVITANGALPTCGAFPTGNANCATPASHLRTLPFRFSDVRLDRGNNADLGLRKDIPLDGEASKKIQLRAEFINAFNHPALTAPVISPSSKGAAIPGVCDNTPAKPCPGDFGTINYLNTSNQLNYARRAQLSAKFIF
jgi:hypothetical protein